jgi:hypothetical protein
MLNENIITIPKLANSWSATFLMLAIYIKLQLLVMRVLIAPFGAILVLSQRCQTPTSNADNGIFNTCRNYELRQSGEVIPLI